MLLIDSHAHYDDKAYDGDRHEVIMDNKDYVHAIINAAVDLDSTRVCKDLAYKYDFIYATCGIHPHEAKTYTKEVMDLLYEEALDKRVVAIGETGLDYHYDFSPRDKQKENFIANIDLARQVKKPLVVHMREATEDTINILKDEKDKSTPCVMHSFTGSYETALELNKMDVFYSIGGVITFKNAKKIVEAIKAIPLDRLMLETDCPYMTPVPYRGKRNQSKYLIYVAKEIARLLNRDYQEIIEITNTNAKGLFCI